MDAADREVVAREIAQRMYDADLASQTLGITLHDIGPGVTTARMLISEIMINGHGIVHGGYVFLLADTAFAFACNTYGRATVAREASISFLRPVQLGDELTAVAAERHRDDRNGIYDVSVRRANGEVVAEFRGHSRALR